MTSSSACLDGLLVTHCPSQSVSLVTRSQSTASLERPPPAPPRPRSKKERGKDIPSPEEEYEPELWRPSELERTKVYRPLETQVESAPIYRTASKATLVDQESGNVYQLIEKQRGKSSETFLLQQPLSSPAPRPPAPPPKSMGLPVQASIDLGMLHQARRDLQPVTSQGGSFQDQPYYQVPKHCQGSYQGSLASDWQARDSIRERLREQQGEERCLLLPDPSPGSLEYLPRDLPSCLPPPSSVERYIAVPLSATEQYLISSSGQAYLTEQLPPLMPPPTTPASVTVHSSESGETQSWPSGERPPPLGANSRVASKLSLDLLQDEADLEEEERQKLLMDARVRMAVQDLQDHETTC